MPAAALSAITAVTDRIDAAEPPAPEDVFSVLGAVSDPRAARGVRYRFVSLLALSVCAVLAGARSFVAIGEWAADLPASVRLALGLGRASPSESTIRRGLQQVDPAELDAALSGWLVAQCTGPEHGPRVVAIDGKTVRGARGVDGQAVHLLAALDAGTGVVLGQVRVEGKSNEITAFPELVKGIEVAGALVTADAMHTQRGHVVALAEAGAHWLFIVKGNQPTLHAQLKAMPWREVPVTDVAVGKGHGRAERRTLKVAELVTGLDFPNARLAIKLVRTRQPRGARRCTETIYAITDLSWHQINPVQIADAMRAHWHIENRLHWVRDVTFAEDHSQVRTGHGPVVMAGLRNFAISRHRLDHPRANIAERLRSTARHPLRALRLIT